MRLIVDVMNVLHVWRAGPEAGKAADVVALARAIRRSRFAGSEVVLVCDGTPPPGVETVDGGFEAEGWRVLFSGAGLEADDVIEGLVAGDGPVRETVIVSSDRRLGRAARKRGARSMGSRTFVQVLVDDAQSLETGPSGEPAGHDEGVLASGEVAAWLETFGMGESDTKGAARDRERDPAPPAEPGPRPEGAGDWLADAQREWRISEEDLDMDRWLEGDADTPGEPDR